MILTANTRRSIEHMSDFDPRLSLVPCRWVTIHRRKVPRLVTVYMIVFVHPAKPSASSWEGGISWGASHLMALEEFAINNHGWEAIPWTKSPPTLNHSFEAMVLRGRKPAASLSIGPVVVSFKKRQRFRWAAFAKPKSSNRRGQLPQEKIVFSVTAKWILKGRHSTYTYFDSKFAVSIKGHVDSYWAWSVAIMDASCCEAISRGICFFSGAAAAAEYSRRGAATLLGLKTKYITRTCSISIVGNEEAPIHLQFCWSTGPNGSKPSSLNDVTQHQVVMKETSFRAPASRRSLALL